MPDIINSPIKDRDIFYYRRRLKNRLFSALLSFIAEEGLRTGATKSDIAKRLKRNSSELRFSDSSDLSLEMISDVLLALDAEIDPPPIVRFSDRKKSNYAHPLIAEILGKVESEPTNATNRILNINDRRRLSKPSYHLNHIKPQSRSPDENMQMFTFKVDGIANETLEHTS